MKAMFIIQEDQFSTVMLHRLERMVREQYAKHIGKYKLTVLPHSP